MDYEKKYEKLVDAVKVLRDNNPSDEGIQNWVNDNVPELKESEDEKIRKEIIVYLSTVDDKELIPYESWIAWLEKQRQEETDPRYENLEELLAADDIYQMAMNDDMVQEAKTKAINALSELEIGKLLGVEKKEPQVYETEDGEVITYSESEGYKVVEPKFKVGDWVVWKDKNYKVNYNGCGYELFDQNGLSTSWAYKTIEDDAHLWTIQDAKDGDVLALDWKDEQWQWQKIVIFKSLNEFGVEGYGNTFKNNKLAFMEDVPYYSKTWSKYLHPATKEQRDALMKSMTDAGYTFDFESKELKEIAVPIFNIGDTIIKKRNSDINDFGQFTITDITGGKYWYNDRIICDITEQDKWEIYESVKQNPAWGEEDERMYNALILACQYMIEHFENSTKPYEDAIDWLKSLKERMRRKFN